MKVLRRDVPTRYRQRTSLRSPTLLFLCAVVCCCTALVSPPQLKGQTEPSGQGCQLTHAALPTLPDLTPRSGDPRLDRAMIAEIRKVDRIFRINPAYTYFRDQSPNAYATTDNLVNYPRTRGTIAFGLNLLRTELSTEYGGAAIAGIAAHEGAHIFQFFHPNRNLQQRLRGPNARKQELHADFLAGYYFAATGRTERSLVVFANSLLHKGDYQYNDPDHHGTPTERVQAMRAGYRQGHLNLEEAARRGIQYVLGM